MKIRECFFISLQSKLKSREWFFIFVQSKVETRECFSIFVLSKVEIRECFLFLSSLQLKMVNTFHILCIIYSVYITMLGISMHTTLQYKTKLLHIKNRGFELLPLNAFFYMQNAIFEKHCIFTMHSVTY